MHNLCSQTQGASCVHTCAEEGESSPTLVSSRGNLWAAIAPAELRGHVTVAYSKHFFIADLLQYYNVITLQMTMKCLSLWRIKVELFSIYFLMSFLKNLLFVTVPLMFFSDVFSHLAVYSSPSTVIRKCTEFALLCFAMGRVEKRLQYVAALFKEDGFCIHKLALSWLYSGPK